jgi:hypothetical protein
VETSEISLTYDEALKLGRKGNVSHSIIQAMRKELSLKMHTDPGPPSALIAIKTNLAVSLINYANSLGSNYIGTSSLYKESEMLLLSVLELDPGNGLANTNLKKVRTNLKVRVFRDIKPIRLYNPSIVWVSKAKCQNVVLRRLHVQPFSSTLFTCDTRTDMGLLWVLESEDLEVEDMSVKVGGVNLFCVHHFQVYDARALIWKQDLCWISSGGGWTKGPVYMMFHCIRLDSFISQMEQSARRKELLPLLHVRGGRILSDRQEVIEKNWSPFVVNNTLFMTYSSVPHIVLKCDWGAEQHLLQCVTVQKLVTSISYEMIDSFRSDLRGSSTGLSLPTGDEFISLGHVNIARRLRDLDYRFFFYSFQGETPPFRINAFSRLFRLPVTKTGSFQYGHGISLDSDQLIVTFGVSDETSWYVKIPLVTVKAMLAQGDKHPNISWSGITPLEFPLELFGKSLLANLKDMMVNLENSDNDIAKQFLLFWNSVPSATLIDCFGRMFEQRRIYHDVVQALEQRDCLYEDTNDAGAIDGNCTMLLDNTRNAFWAYVTILCRADRMLQAAVENSQVNAPAQDSPDIAKQSSDEAMKQEMSGQSGSEKYELQTSTDGGQDIHIEKSSPLVSDPGADAKGPDVYDLPFSEALRLVSNGETSHNIVESMRREHEKAKKLKAENLVEIKIHLGLALLRLGNQSPDPSTSSLLHKESELVLASALTLLPGGSQ